MTDYKISLNETNAIKGLAIIAMLLHHLFYTHPELGFLVHQIGLIGKVCVAMFLFLSGYGLTIQFSKVQSKVVPDCHSARQTLLFLYKRFVKFYLNYWIVFLITVPIGIFVFGRNLDQAYGEGANMPFMLLKDFCGINEFQSYNITWWFNKLILRLYLYFPIYYTLIGSRNIYIKGLSLLYIFQNPEYFAFALGIFIASEIQTINKWLSYFNPKTIVFISLVLVFVCCFLRQVSPIPNTNGLFADAFLAIFISSLVVSLSRLCSLEYKVLSFLGKHSMNMYLIHTYILGYFFQEFVYGLGNPILMFMVVLFLSLLLSIVIEIIKQLICLSKFKDKLLSIAQ